MTGMGIVGSGPRCGAGPSGAHGYPVSFRHDVLNLYPQVWKCRVKHGAVLQSGLGTRVRFDQD